MRDAVRPLGLNPTRQIDRHWFRSVYFREHGGVLFELATSGPGYTSDEPLDELGERLVLPGRFEDRRAEIEAGLADVTVPRAGTAEADD
jgi:glyoxalase family protein